MAPGTRRANRSGYAEHDDFEGLPVRQWRQDWINVAPLQTQEQLQQNDIWSIELIHGMPKDSTLLAPHSQELLRAARSGRLYKRPAPAEEEEVDVESAQAAEKTEKKDEDNVVQGFSIKLWKQIPRNSEVSGLSHLAKRRKGTVTIASRTIEEKTAGPTVTRATVRRIDAAGNPYTEEVTLADGQQVVGEIISTRVEAAPGAAADGFVAPAPPLRRRPPPPKRKSKAGPGRGKKKIKNSLPGEGLAGGVAPAANAATAVKIQGRGQNETSLEGIVTPNLDSEMVDGDDDDEEDGEEGDDGDDEEQGEGDLQSDEAGYSKIKGEEATDAGDEAQPSSLSKPVVDGMGGIMNHTDEMPLNPFTLAPPLLSLATNSPKNEGSPLKNVMLQSQSPTETQTPPTMSIRLDSVDNSPVPTAVPVELSALAPVPSGITDSGPPKPESSIAEPLPSVADVEGPLKSDADITMNEADFEQTTKADEVPRDILRSETLMKVPGPEKSFPDVSSTVGALLPPPPEQVGNISSPKADDGPDRSSDFGDKSRDGHVIDSGMVSERLFLGAHDSVMTEDTIKPEDSASVRFTLTESGAPSEVGTASAEETKDSAAVSSELPLEPSPLKVASPILSAEQSTPPTAELKSDSAMTAANDVQRMHDQLEQESPPAQVPITGNTALLPESRASRQTFENVPFADPNEISSTETRSGDDLAPVTEKSTKEALPLPVELPKRAEDVPMEELKTHKEIQPKNTATWRNFAEPAYATTEEESKKDKVDDQRPHPEGESKDEPQEESIKKAVEELKPDLELESALESIKRPASPQQVEGEALSTSDDAPSMAPAAAPASPTILTPILPPVLPSVAELSAGNDVRDGEEEKKEDLPVDA